MKLLFTAIRCCSLGAWFALFPTPLLADAAFRVNFARWETNEWQVARDPEMAQPGRWTQERDHIRAGEKTNGVLNLLYRPVNAAEVTAETQVTFSGEGVPALMLRAQATDDEVGDTYFALLHQRGLDLWRRVNGRFSRVAHSRFAPAPDKPHRLRAATEGWRLRVWVDETLMVEAEDATIPMMGSFGLWAAGGVCRFYDFTLTAQTPPETGREPAAWQVVGTSKADESGWSNLASRQDGRLTWGDNSTEKRIESLPGAMRVSARANAAAASHYIGMLLPVPVRDVRQHQVLLDLRTSTPNTTDSVYVRLYNAAGQRVASWTGRPRMPSPAGLTLRLPVGAGDAALAWEATGLKGEPGAVTAIELIVGTQQPNVTFDLIAGNLRTIPDPPSVRRIDKVKPLFLETALVARGKPAAVIVAPERHTALAHGLQTRIRELTGVTIPVLDDQTLADAQGRWNGAGLARRAESLLVLGSLEANRLLPLLYARFYTAVDALYPGVGGHALHTVHDPWGNGRNVVVIGGSDADGVGAAAKALLTELSKRPAGPDLSLPRLLQLKPAPALLREMPELNRNPDEKAIVQAVAGAREAFARGQHTGVTRDLFQAGLNYARSGHEGYAEQFKRLARLMIELYRAKQASYGGPWGMDADFNSMQVIAAWDLVEESPVFTERERLEITRIIAEYAGYLGTFGNFQDTTRHHIRNNHNTFPALGMLFAAEYFGKYYRVDEAARWLAAADACFQSQALSFKAQEDANGYQWLPSGHLMRYALARPDHTYFANGNARRTLDLAVVTMDNLGFQSPFGDVGAWRGWATEVGLWEIGAWYFDEPAYRWAVEKERAVQPKALPTLAQYATAIPAAKPPEAFTGLRVFPIDRKFYDHWAPRATNAQEQVWVAPPELAYEKVSFRGGFDPQQPYLLLDGIGCGDHRHYDGNAIIRYSDRGREWFADGDYLKALPKFHTSVLVFRDGKSTTLPPFCALEARADLPGAGFVSSTVRGYGDADWTRTLVWLKGACFVAIDSLKTRAAGEYSFRTVWHTLGEPALTGQRLTLEQKGERFVLENLDGARLKLTNDEELGKNWIGYSNAAPVVRILQQVVGREMQAGESYHFLNVFGAVNQEPVKAELASDTSLRVTVNGQATLVGVTDGSRTTVAPGLATDAAIYWLRPRGFALAKATTLVADGGTLFRSDAPVNIEFDAASGRAVIQSPARVTIELPDQSTHIVPPGRQEVVVTGNPKAASLALLPPRAAKSTPRSKVVAAVARVPELPVRWSLAGTFTCFGTADLDGNRRSETVAGGSDGRVRCLGPDGRERWEFAAKSPVKAVWAGDPGIAVGCADGTVHLLDAQGRKLWSHEFPYYKRKPVVTVVFGADLDGDGQQEIIVGTEAWRFHALDRDGKERWRYESVHASTCGTAVDLDGDGREEVLAGTEYYRWHAIAPNGQQRWAYSGQTGPRANCVAAGDLTGAGKRAVVFGGADGNLHVLDAAGKLLWQFNTGDEVTAVAVVGGRVFATSMNFNLYALDATGKPLWRRECGEALRSLALLNTRRAARLKIAVGGEDGRVAVYDSSGVLQGEVKLSGPISQLSASDLDGNGWEELVALDGRGGVFAIGSGKD